MSFNTLVRKSLEKTVRKSSADWLDGMFEQMDRYNISSIGKNGLGKNHIVAKIFIVLRLWNGSGQQ
jgi:hypothetical protein